MSTPIGATIMLGPNIYKWSGGRTTRLDVGVRCCSSARMKSTRAGAFAAAIS